MNYDIGVIGGGIQGVGVAQAAAAAGYRVVLWEQSGVASGTSSRSSKLIHGGLRYLESGQFSLVRKSLSERSLLLVNAPELVHPVPFYIPVYADSRRRPWQIRLGLSLYALLGRFKKYARFRRVRDPKEIARDGIRLAGLQSLYQYWDAQTDDAALTRAVLKSATDLGAEHHCPARVVAIKKDAQAYQVVVEQQGAQQTYHCASIVNAAGPWVNHVLKLVQPGIKILPADLVQGTHIVVNDQAPDGIYYVEAPQDQRAVFVMPWQGKTMIGTTEKYFDGDDPAQVAPTQQELDYLLEVYWHYFPERRGEIIEAFAGLRVLPKQKGRFFHRPRDTVIHIDPGQPRLLTLYGGKLTGYRATAEEVVQCLQSVLVRRERKADTRTLPLTQTE